MLGMILKVINDTNFEQKINRMSDYLQININNIDKGNTYIDDEWYIRITDDDITCCLLNKKYIKGISRPVKVIRWHIKITNQDGTSEKIYSVNKEKLIEICNWFKGDY